MSNQISVLFQCSFDYTEIKVYNHYLAEVAHNFGSFSIYLDKGYYAIRYKIGPHEEEKILEVPTGKKEVIFNIKDLDFKSFIPFNKEKFIEGEDFFYNSIKNLDINRKYFSIDKEEGSFLICIHGEFHKKDKKDYLNLMQCFQIKNIDGNVIHTFDKNNVVIRSKKYFFNIISHVFMTQGNYILSYKANGNVFEQIIYCAKQLTNQIFFCVDDGKIDLKSQICVYDKFVDNFQETDDSLKVTEVLFRGINNSHVIASKAQLVQLSKKYPSKPSLLIYGTLNYIKNPDFDRGLVKWILGECISLLGEYNDLKILREWEFQTSRNRKEEVGMEGSIDIPNSLVEIWNLFLEIYEDNEFLIPANSLLSNIGARIVYLSSWVWWESIDTNEYGFVEEERPQSYVVNKTNIQDTVLEVMPSSGFHYALQNNLIKSKTDHLIIDYVRKAMSPIEFYKIISKAKLKFPNENLDKVYEIIISANIENQIAINNYLVKGEKNEFLPNDFVLTSNDRCNEYLMGLYKKEFEYIFKPKSIISNLRLPIYSVFRKLYALMMMSLRLEVFNKGKDSHSNAVEASKEESNLLFSDFEK